MPTDNVVQLMTTLPLGGTYSVAQWQSLSAMLIELRAGFGDSEYKLAMESLKNVRLENDERAQQILLASALGHLEGAAAQLKAASEEWSDKLRASCYTNGFYSATAAAIRLAGRA